MSKALSSGLILGGFIISCVSFVSGISDTIIILYMLMVIGIAITNSIGDLGDANETR